MVRGPPPHPGRPDRRAETPARGPDPGGGLRSRRQPAHAVALRRGDRAGARRGRAPPRGGLGRGAGQGGDPAGRPGHAEIELRPGLRLRRAGACDRGQGLGRDPGPAAEARRMGLRHRAGLPLDVERPRRGASPQTPLSPKGLRGAVHRRGAEAGEIEPFQRCAAASGGGRAGGQAADRLRRSRRFPACPVGEPHAAAADGVRARLAAPRRPAAGPVAGGDRPARRPMLTGPRDPRPRSRSPSPPAGSRRGRRRCRGRPWPRRASRSACDRTAPRPAGPGRCRARAGSARPA